MISTNLLKCKDGKLIGRKMIKVMTSGVFDTLHLGHINILTRAKQQGDYLIVGIQDDESAKKSKGKYLCYTHLLIVHILPLVCDFLHIYNF